MGSQQGAAAAAAAPPPLGPAAAAQPLGLEAQLAAAERQVGQLFMQLQAAAAANSGLSQRCSELEQQLHEERQRRHEAEDAAGRQAS